MTSDPPGHAVTQDPPQDPPRPDADPPGHGLAYALIAVFLLALAFGGWGAWRVLMPAPGDPRAMLRAQQARIDVMLALGAGFSVAELGELLERS